ncbi:MAG: hypothetical protein M3P93_08975, partial [Actinomycetota bacterium]|nr:hypothetical protein [Actinomycetota bacterium]
MSVRSPGAAPSTASSASINAWYSGSGATRCSAAGCWRRSARLKANGHLLRRSPLSDLVEMEALVLGVQGKAAGFRALRSIAAGDPRGRCLRARTHGRVGRCQHHGSTPTRGCRGDALAAIRPLAGTLP